MDRQRLFPIGHGGGKPPDLSQPHPLFPSWTRPHLYNRVTSMFLDCWDDAEIAEALSEELGRPIEPHRITDIREEAALAAESQPLEVRRRWIYRYSHLTVNNLVKEYMFLEAKHDFIKAKREFAEEMESLVKRSAPDRLCVAVNDALGRTNIGIELIHALQAYAKVARKMEALMKAYAASWGLTPEKATAQIADKINSSFKTVWQKDMAQTVQGLAGLFPKTNAEFTTADVEYLMEYNRVHRDEVEQPLIAKRIDGTRMMTRGASALEQAIAGGGHHIQNAQLLQLIDRMRGSPVLGRRELGKVRDYAVRHLQDLKTLRELGRKKQAPEGMQRLETNRLNSIMNLADRHLQLLEHQTFFSRAEHRQAKRCKISESDLQSILNRLNDATTSDEVRRLVWELMGSTKFDFPLDRYLEYRFKVVGQPS